MDSMFQARLNKYLYITVTLTVLKPEVKNFNEETIAPHR